MTAATVGAGTLDAGDPASYRLWREEVLRYGDMDVNGHVNNIAIAQFCEGGRVAFERVCDLQREHAALGLSLAKVTIEFRAEAHFPGIIRVGTRLLGFGRSSCRLLQGVFQDGRCVATSEAVAVCFDTRLRMAVPFGEAFKERAKAASG
ncbi:MAG: acyl-CoA thioesterase [Alphaproteobacteria bacterium]|nr:acyl-CoA thioesterase [Alphaproteobacteria bacterium]